VAKTATKKTARKKKCLYPGCRKMRAPETDTCKAHMGSNGVGIHVQTDDEQEDKHPLEAVTKMTDIERLGLVNVETTCVNLLLQLRNHDLETEELKRKFAADLNSRSSHRAQLVSALEVKKNDQQQTVKDLAEKYGIDPQHMVYDPDTGVVRDMSKESVGTTKE
jgi:hypothetical protein